MQALKQYHWETGFLQLLILISSHWLYPLCFVLVGGRESGSPIHILKALSLISCDWIDLSHMFIPEQVHVQQLEYIDEADCQALPPLDLGLTHPNHLD